VKLQTKAEIILLVCTLIWGSTFAVVKSSLAVISPVLLIAIRFFISAMIVLPSVNWSRLRDRKLLRSGAVLGFLLFVGYATQTIGLQYTTASKSGFITGLLVVFTPIFQVIIDKRLPTWANIVGIISITIGLIFLLSPSGGGFNLGDGLTLICAIAYALYIVLLDGASTHHDLHALTFLIFSSTALYCIFYMIPFEHISFELSIDLILSLVYLSFIATYLTLRWQAQYQRYSDPTRAAVIFAIEPAFAAFIAWLFLSEQMTLVQVYGSGLILLGLFISEGGISLIVKKKEFHSS